MKKIYLERKTFNRLYDTIIYVLVFLAGLSLFNIFVDSAFIGGGLLASVIAMVFMVAAFDKLIVLKKEEKT